jgi:HSP20 family molecular chaperone IbpA
MTDTSAQHTVAALAPFVVESKVGYAAIQQRFIDAEEWLALQTRDLGAKCCAKAEEIRQQLPTSDKMTFEVEVTGEKQVVIDAVMAGFRKEQYTVDLKVERNKEVSYFDESETRFVSTCTAIKDVSTLVFRLPDAKKKDNKDKGAPESA